MRALVLLSVSLAGCAGHNVVVNPEDNPIEQLKPRKPQQILVAKDITVEAKEGLIGFSPYKRKAPTLL